MKKTPDENGMKDLVREVLEKPKYQHLHKGLVETVAMAELAKGRKKKETQKAVLSKLHQVGAVVIVFSGHVRLSSLTVEYGLYFLTASGFIVLSPVKSVCLAPC